MNCSRFRFLIQQWFDSPISPQDERMVLAHVESCDSCARFQHQLDQVIQSTAEVPLPDECLPSNLEALAKRIVVEIPQDKPGIMGIFQKIFPFLGGGASKPKQKPQKGKAPKGKGKQQQPVQEMDMDEEDMDHSGSMFPHRKKSLEDLPPSQQKPKKSGPATAEVDEEMLATSTRLKSFQNKMQPQEDDQSKSQGLSLGNKFNMNIPERGGGRNEDSPLTLAESIRRKVGEEQKAQVTSGQQPILDQGSFDNDSPFAPPPGQFNPQGQGFPPPQGFPQGGPMTGQWADASGMPAPQPAGNWGDPPVPGVGGDHDWKPNAPASDWQMAKPQAPGWSSGPQPGAAPSPSDSQGWSSQQDWSQPQQQQQQPQAQPQAGWSAPPQPVPAGGDNWNTQQSSGTNWSNQAPKEANEWNGSQPNSSWNAQQGEPGSWSSTPQPDWNKQQTESGGWDAPQQPAQGGWNQPAAGAGGWSQPQAQPAQDQGGWSQPQPAQAQTAQDQGGWSQPAQAQPAQNSSWSAGPQQGNSWPPTPVQQQPDQSWGKTSGDWAAGNQNQSNWNAPPQPQQQMQPPMPQPQQMQQQQTQEWANMAGQQPDWAQPGQTTASPWSDAPQAPRQDNSDSWSEEGEQIQTGMWQAFTLAEPEIGGGNRGQMRPETQDVNRFEAPIQARNEDPASMAAAAAGKADPSLFDIPIQERMRMQQQQQQQQQQEPAQRWDVPSQQQPQPPAPPAPPAPAAGPAINKNSIMDRLNKVLGDDLAAMAGDAQQGGWSSTPPAPPAPPAAPRLAPPPAPAPMAPQPAPMAPQPAAAQSSQFDIPIQERMRQQGGAPEPVAAASASSGLFKLDDKAIDKVFRDNLGVADAGAPAAAPAAPAAPAAAVPPPAPPVPPPSPMAAPPPVPPAQPRMAPPVPPAVAQMGGPKISAIPARPEPAAVAAPAAAQAGAVDQSSGLFKNLDDRAMDQIFTNLGVKEEVGAGVQPSAPMAHSAPPAPPVPPLGQAPARQAPPPPPIPPVAAPAPPPAPSAPGGWNQAPAPAPAPAAPAAPAAPPLHPSQRGEGRGLLNVDDDAMDRIFEGLGVQEKPAPIGKANLSTAVSQVRAIADVPTPPQVSVPGISRLSREEAVAEATPGKIHQIGKFLLDQQDLAKIGRLTEQDLADAKVRVLTNEASEEINKLLEHIAGQPGVVGSVIVGHDGILIANSLPRDLDPETIGILSLGIYINTTNSTKQLGHNHLHQLVCSTPYGFLVIADFGGGILVTVSNDRATEKLIPLMRTITQLVAQA